MKMRTRLRLPWLRALAVSWAIYALPVVAAAEEHTHNISIFGGGATSTGDGSDTGFSFGGEYEYKFNPIIGIGGLLEFTTSALDRDAILLAPLTLHPFGGLSVVAALGVEFAEDDDSFAFRLGTAYEFPLGRFSFAPVFNADFIDGDITYVYGLSLGLGF